MSTPQSENCDPRRTAALDKMKSEIPAFDRQTRREFIARREPYVDLHLVLSELLRIDLLKPPAKALGLLAVALVPIDGRLF